MSLTKGNIQAEGRVIAGLATNTPNWQTGQNYIINDEIYESGSLYRCNTAHTASAAFATDSANWTAVGGGGGGTNFFLGTFTDIAALNTANPTPIAGNYAYIDNASSDIYSVIWDATDSTWVEGSEPNADLVRKTPTPLEISIASFSMVIDGANVVFPQTTITLPANENSFICVDLLNYGYHFLRRNITDGVIYLGYVETDGTEVTLINQITPELPKETIPGFKEKLVNGQKVVNIAVLSDSLGTDTGSETGVSFPEMLFSAAQSSFGMNVPSVAVTTLDNYSVGGQTAHYGAMWTGKASRSGTGNFNSTAVSYDSIAQADLFTYSDYKTLNYSPILTKNTDIALIGFGANGGANKLAWLENAVKNNRDAGIETIIYTQNSRASGGVTSNTAYYDEGDTLRAIADAYGCALADSWAFVMEEALKGTPTHDDDIHLLNAGKQATALSVRTIINDKLLPQGNYYVSPERVIKDQTDSFLNKNFPNAVEVDCHHSSTTGTLVASAAPDLINPAVQFCGIPSATSVVELAVGQTVKYNNAYATACYIIFDASMDADFDVATQNGATVVNSFSQTGFTGNVPKLAVGIEIAGSGDMTNNRAIQITCTRGTAKIYGIAWLTYKNRTISLDQLKIDGVWNEEPEDYSQPRSLYTDTIGDSVSFEFYGSAAEVYLNRESAAGIVDVYLNGSIVIADFDLYSGGTFVRPLYISDAQGEFYDKPPTRNSVTIHLKGQNASAITPIPTNRRLGIYLVKEFDRR